MSLVRGIVNSIHNKACICLKDLYRVEGNFRKSVKCYSSYESSLKYNPDLKVKYEVSKNPEEWKFVERLMPLKVIPEPVAKDSYASGWDLQKASAEEHPYFVRRTKNHMTPVYLTISHRGTKKVTVIKHIQGDVWQFEKDLSDFLNKHNDINVGTRIDEVAGKVSIRGDHVHNVLLWMKEKGF